MLESSHFPIFQGQIFYFCSSTYVTAIFPFVQIKKIYQRIYHIILQIFWQELIHGEKVDTNVFLLITVCGIALVSYYLRSYTSLLLSIFLFLWYFDGKLAKKQYLLGKTDSLITLNQISEDSMEWQMVFPNQQVSSSIFRLTQVSYISIHKKPIYGGAFEEIIDYVWQINLNFYDGSNLIIDENINLNRSLEKAKAIAQFFSVSLIFQASQGYNRYVEEDLEEDKIRIKYSPNFKSVNIKRTSNKQHIYTKWGLGQTWQLIKKVVQKSGFWLFLIVFTSCMEILGQALHLFIMGFLFSPDRAYEMNIIQVEPSSGFPLSINRFKYLELLIALGIIIFQGWKLSKVKHIYLDQDWLKYCIDNRKIFQIKILTIESILLIKEPEPEILILSSSKIQVINQFQSLEDSQAFLIYLQDEISKFNNLLN